MQRLLTRLLATSSIGLLNLCSPAQAGPIQTLLGLPEWVEFSVDYTTEPMGGLLGGENPSAATWFQQTVVGLTIGSGLGKDTSNWREIDHWQANLVPALTFVASGTAIALAGATPVIVDVDPETYNIDPDAMEAVLTPATKAAVVVHNGGYPADMDRIMDLAQRRGLKIVEDSAHAHASQWRGKGAGCIGDFGTFSFQMGKTLTAGEGGAVLTNDDTLALLAGSYHQSDRMPERPVYEFHRLASNLRMTEWQGAILRPQLQRLQDQTETRERNTRYLLPPWPLITKMRSKPWRASCACATSAASS